MNKIMEDKKMENVKYQRKEGVQLFINEELELEVRAIKNEDRSVTCF